MESVRAIRGTVLKYREKQQTVSGSLGHAEKAEVERLQEGESDRTKETTFELSLEGREFQPVTREKKCVKKEGAKHM